MYAVNVNHKPAIKFKTTDVYAFINPLLALRSHWKLCVQLEKRYFIPEGFYYGGYVSTIRHRQIVTWIKGMRSSFISVIR